MVFVGQYPFHNGFLLPADEAAGWLAADPALSGCLRPYLIGRDLVELGKPSRWIIDFGQNDIFHAMSFPRAFERVKATVMPDVLAHAEEEKAKTGKATTRWTRVAERWWQFRDYQPGTIRAVRSVPRYIACSRVTKRPIFEFIDKGINPDNTIVVFPMADDYSFGIIQSSIHFEWFKARCSSLKGDFRYTSDTVFDSFPWPQSPTRKQLEAVAREAVALRQLRREVMAKMDWSLRDLYRTLEEPGSNPLRDAQARLDLAVRAAYGMPKDADILAFLLALNQTCAAKEAAGDPITPPGLPLPVEERETFVTNDCIRAQRLPSAAFRFAKDIEFTTSGIVSYNGMDFRIVACGVRNAIPFAEVFPRNPELEHAIMDEIEFFSGPSVHLSKGFKLGGNYYPYRR